MLKYEMRYNILFILNVINYLFVHANYCRDRRINTERLRLKLKPYQFNWQS
jgi:hypothetical protein